MTSPALALNTPIRPKIYRLPAARPQKKAALLPKHAFFGAFCLAATALVVMGTGSLLAHIASDEAENKVISDAAAAFPPPGKPQTRTVKQGQAIVITGNNGGIVGQMAKIPVQNEQIVEIKTVSGVDKRTGHDLLTIIGKY